MRRIHFETRNVVFFRPIEIALSIMVRSSEFQCRKDIVQAVDFKYIPSGVFTFFVAFKRR